MPVNSPEQVQSVFEMSLGLVFLASSVAKLRNPKAFVEGVIGYHLLPLSLARVYGRLLPLIELCTALLLVSGLLLPFATGLAILMLVSFAIATSAVTMQGRDLDCHCFGVHQWRFRTGWHTLMRNLVLLLPAIWLFLTMLLRKSPVTSVLQSNSKVELAMLSLAFASSYILLGESLELLLSFSAVPRSFGPRI